MEKSEHDICIGDLVVVAYDCWIHNFNGSEHVLKGDMAVVVQRRDQLMYKPIKIYTQGGKIGWVYASNIEIIAKNLTS